MQKSLTAISLYLDKVVRSEVFKLNLVVLSRRCSELLEEPDLAVHWHTRGIHGRQMAHLAVVLALDKRLELSFEFKFLVAQAELDPLDGFQRTANLVRNFNFDLLIHFFA